MLDFSMRTNIDNLKVLRIENLFTWDNRTKDRQHDFLIHPFFSFKITLKNSLINLGLTLVLFVTFPKFFSNFTNGGRRVFSG